MCERHMHFAFLIEIRRRNPLMQGEGGARGIENGTALDDAQPVRQPQPQAFEFPCEYGTRFPDLRRRVKRVQAAPGIADRHI